ncbi:MAG: hypothetical protein KC421_28365, partial [Anaerolineales bacterium]|nr:hypothetical protein [Anaerolineales bacterium]
MTLLRQIIQLLSESPGNIVYHLVTLFALQAIFAISFTHWRRNPMHQFATRSMWAAGSIFIIRLLLLGAGLVLIEVPALAVVVLPLLEQALNTLTIMLMVWALVPHSNRLPHLGHLLLLLGVLVSLAMTISFIPTWRALSADGIAYNSTSQATIWGLLQIVVLAAGFILAMLNARWRGTLSPVILLFMLLAHVAHFWNYPEIIPTDTNIIYWIRLGHLVALPLWAAMAYRQSIMPLLLAQRKKSGLTTDLQSAILNAAQVIQTEDRDAALPAAVTLIASVVDASFVAVGVLTEDAQPTLALTSNLPQVGTDQPRTWLLPVSDWTALEAVVSQRRWVELNPEGVGAGQLHRFYEELAIGPFGALFLQPMLDENQIVGLLLLAQPQGTAQVSQKDRELAPMLAELVVSKLTHIERFMQRSALIVPPPVAAETAVSGRIIALEEAGKKLQDQLNVAQDRLVQAENRAAAAGKRAHDLAA